ncbi:dTDP-glucose 4,6-dehydratase [Actinoplanes sp. NBRC 14428]|nr:polysaccharide biosynthesis protein [Pseudosporangium ferrugineum]BCJ52060.1 dTDP-glucose 4,6-dehydratase [Actinoplanes sp. NBRC 14428]
MLAVIARYGLAMDAPLLARAAGAALAAALVHSAVGHLGYLYRGRYRYGTFDEARAVAGSAVITSQILLIADLLVPARPVPASAPLLGGAVALVLMLAARYVRRVQRERLHRPDPETTTPVVLFGAGATGISVLRSMLTDPRSVYRPVGLLDDDPAKRHLRACGVPVLGSRRDLAAALTATRATTVVFCVANADAALIRSIRGITLGAGAEFKVVPSMSELIDTRVEVADVRDVQITDLLGRHQVDTDVEAVAGFLTGKRVLVLGAGGSIGSELCRQIDRYQPAELLMLDRDESALHAVQLSLRGRALLDDPAIILADLRDADTIRHVFATRRPQVVFHAAALKHLPLLERYPAEALYTNVWGTLDVLEAARDVERFVNISTDKAADPVSVLGYSKRITERLTAHTARVSPGTFLSVRFGNVLGSRGSVLTAFSAQIAAGGPLTVTDPEVTRYLMTIQEAVQLVIQAAAIGRDGEALVLEMGKPVKIAELARQMAALASKPVAIEYGRLRPGEKLHEDLFGTGEFDVRPLHPAISHVPVPPLDPERVRLLNPYAEPPVLAAELARLCVDDTATAAAPGGVLASVDRSS